jgi:hypothetical protein
VEVWESVREVKLKGWTIKWDDGSYEAFVNDYSFVLLDEEKDSLMYISFEGGAFVIKSRRYGTDTKVDPLNTTITIVEEKEEEDEN